MLHDHAELVAAQAAYGVGGAQHRGYGLGSTAQQVVASRVAASVIDHLQEIEIEHHNSGVIVGALGLGCDLGQAVHPSRPVKHTSKRIDEGVALHGNHHFFSGTQLFAQSYCKSHCRQAKEQFGCTQKQHGTWFVVTETQYAAHMDAVGVLEVGHDEIARRTCARLFAEHRHFVGHNAPIIEAVYTRGIAPAVIQQAKGVVGGHFGEDPLCHDDVPVCLLLPAYEPAGSRQEQL